MSPQLEEGADRPPDVAAGAADRIGPESQRIGKSGSSLWRWLSRGAGVVAMGAFASHMAAVGQIENEAVMKPDPAAGRISPYNEHGRIYYATAKEAVRIQQAGNTFFIALGFAVICSLRGGMLARVSGSPPRR